MARTVQFEHGPGLVILIALLLACRCLFAQQRPVAPEGETQAPGADSDTSDGTPEVLQKASQNTVASVLSIPIENKTNFDIGPYGRNQNLVSVKPLIPVRLSRRWRLIARIIQPFRWQPDVAHSGGGGESGLGDMTPTFFVSPVPRGTIAWGAGPAFVIPTATSRVLGQGKFSLGPEFAFFLQPAHWTYGILVSNLWSVAGSGGRPDVNQMKLQYFLAYRLRKGWDIGTSPIVTANWNGSEGNVWTVPVGGGVGKIVHFGPQAAKVSAHFYAHALRPSGGSRWSMRLQTEFFFPKKKQHDHSRKE